MEIEPFVSRSVLTVEEGDSLSEVATWMMERGVGSAVVVSDGKPVGIVTDRDAIRVIARGENPKNVTAGECVLKSLRTYPSTLEIREAARVMREKGFRHLVIVDDQGDLAGVFSMRDLVVSLLEEARATA